MPRRFTVEDSVRLKAVGDARISADGATIAFTVSDAFVASGDEQTELPRSRIYAVPYERGEAAPLTAGPRADTNPRWSPASGDLCFLSDREKDGRHQVYLLPTGGGEARQLTDLEGDIPSPRSLDPLKWFADGSRIAFLKVDAVPEDARERRKRGGDEIVFEASDPYMRLWTVLPNGKDGSDAGCVSPDGVQIWEFDISPNGVRVAAVVSDFPQEWDWYRCRLAVFDLGGDQVTTLVDTPRQVAKPVWSPDGETIAYLTSNWSDRGSDAGDVMVIPASGGEARNLTTGEKASFDSIRWSPDGASLIATANVDGGSGVARIDAASADIEWLWQAEQWMTGLSMTAEGRLATVITTPESPREVYAGEISDDAITWRRVSAEHTELDDTEPAQMRAIAWIAADGLEIPGRVLTPPGHDGSEPLPVVAMIHGGPASAARAGFEDGHMWSQLLAANGFAVYMPNYRGSTGRGLEFTESNIGDMGGKDFEDMLAGLDHLISEGIVDARRQGICGWSYGGFTTAWAVTQTDRFAAAVMGAGISDWRSFHGRSYLNTWDVIHYGGSDPYEPESAHARFSPINYVGNVRTPTLILHGELDWDVPVEQSYQFFRALKERDVETELVVYPREPHGPKEYEHLIDIGNRLVGWFAHRL